MLSQFGFVGMKWMKKTFEEVVLFARTGLNPRQNFKLGQGNNNYITIKNIKNNSLVIDDNTDVVDDEAIKLIHKRSQIKKGDVLFASIGRMGDMFIIEEEPIGWDINESVFAFTLNTNIVKQKYFYYIFRVKSTLDYLISNSSGSTFKSIKMNQLKKMVFDIPQLEEQDYIISVLDKVCDVIEKRKQELEFLDNLIKARFDELFGDPVSNPKKWNVKKLKDLSIQINSGNTPKGGAENYVEEGIVFFRSQNVWKDRLEMDDIAYIDAKTHASMKRSSLKHGDILMTKTGRINTENSSLGRAALYLGEDDMANVNGHVYFIRLKPEVNNKFILRILVSPEYRDLIRSVCVGGIDKRQLNKEHIEDFPIICPPSDIVEKYVAFVDQVDKSKFMKSF